MIDPFIKEQRIRRACAQKLRFTMEEAAQKFGTKPDDVLLYICPNCSFLHFGHKPTWEMNYRELTDKRRVKEAAERRKQFIAQANASRGLLARTAGQRTDRSSGKGYQGRVPLNPAAKGK